MLNLLHLQLLLPEHFLDVLLFSRRLKRQQLPVFRKLEHARRLEGLGLVLPELQAFLELSDLLLLLKLAAVGLFLEVALGLRDQELGVCTHLLFLRCFTGLERFSLLV